MLVRKSIIEELEKEATTKDWQNIISQVDDPIIPHTHTIEEYEKQNPYLGEYMNRNMNALYTCIRQIAKPGDDNDLLLAAYVKITHSRLCLALQAMDREIEMRELERMMGETAMLPFLKRIVAAWRIIRGKIKEIDEYGQKTK